MVLKSICKAKFENTAKKIWKIFFIFQGKISQYFLNVTQKSKFLKKKD